MAFPADIEPSLWGQEPRLGSVSVNLPGCAVAVFDVWRCNVCVTLWLPCKQQLRFTRTLTNKLEQDERAAAMKALQSHALRLKENERSSSQRGPLADGGAHSPRLSGASLALFMQEQRLFGINVLSDSMEQPRQALTTSQSQVQAQHLVLDLYFVRQLAAALEQAPTVDAHGRLRWRV